MKAKLILVGLMFLTGSVAIAAGVVTPAQKIVARARLEATRQVVYDSTYRQLKYPGGDVSANRGVCADVIVRALRAAGYDLQQLIHEDKQRRPRAYPTRGLDSNIDHRRCADQIAFMRRHAKALTTRTDQLDLGQWQPGDLVYVNLTPGKGRLLHCGVVSDKKNGAGIPYLIHNIGPYASEEDALRTFQIIAHFRYP